MLLNRADDEDGLMLANSSSRSCKLLFYEDSQPDVVPDLQAYDGIILEVADAGQVTSVTLF
jgi:hypothetical protein